MNQREIKSINPGIAARIVRIQSAEMCRFCLTKKQLVDIPENSRIQMLLAECYHGYLGKVHGNSPKFVCSGCYQRIEQNYEFILLASRVQALMDTYTFHEGLWPREVMLEESCKPSEKRIASPDNDDDIEMKVRAKKVRFEEAVEEIISDVTLDDSVSSSVTLSIENIQCSTPVEQLEFDLVPFGSSRKEDLTRNSLSLETTVSGEIPGSDLDETPGSSAEVLSFELDSMWEDDYKGEAVPVRKVSTSEMMVTGGSSKDSMVQKLCVQIQEIDVNVADSRSGEMIAKTATLDEAVSYYSCSDKSRIL